MSVYPSEKQNHRILSLHSMVGKRRLSTFQLEQLKDLTLSYPVLVTDDDMMSRALHRAIFEQHDLRLVETHSSNAALEICHTQPISLVISDIMKPHMDGLEMLQYLRSDSRTEHIPLIFVTATNGTHDTAFQYGADAFIRKPFHPHDLLVEVWRLLSKRIK